jgi:hypothetical protein
MEGEACVQGGRLVYKGARLVYRGGDSSIEEKTRLRRGRLVHRGGDSSTEGETLLRDRLVYGAELFGNVL